jgi:hypothetical protein
MTDIQLTFYVANSIPNYQITSGLYQHDNTLTIDLKKMDYTGCLKNGAQSSKGLKE